MFGVLDFWCGLFDFVWMVVIFDFNPLTSLPPFFVLFAPSFP
jgi:hypothetical protein